MRKVIGLAVLVLFSFCAGSFSTWAWITPRHKQEIQDVFDKEERKWSVRLMNCKQDLNTRVVNTELRKDMYWEPKLQEAERELRELKKQQQK